MKRRVILAGWGQVTQSKHAEEELIHDPLGLMAEASFKAFEMTESFDSSRNLDAVMVVKVMSRYYEAADRALADKMSLAPRFSTTSHIGGNSPQTLINRAAGMIARGELESVLITGAETYYQREKSVESRGNRLFQGFPSDYRGDDIIGATESESRHGMSMPIHGFPLYETALWAESGLSLACYMERIGELWASFSRVASTHPNSWSSAARSAQEIFTPSPSNRFIAFPYTKLMNPLVTVDLGAAILLRADERAKQYSGKMGSPVYFLGGGYAEDRQRFLIEKSNFTSSLPLKSAADKALLRSNLSIDDIDCFDLYSCFPSSVTIAKKMLNIQDNDPRALTLTGGLGFFGGPGNNYSLHAVATLADAIKNGRVRNGMITSLGWFMHKHAAGIYSSDPGESDLTHQDLEDAKECKVGNPPVDIINDASGEGVIETYTVLYSRDGAPSFAIIYGKTDKGLRFVAKSHPDGSMVEQLLSGNQVGAAVCLKYDRLNQQNLAMLI